MKTFNKLTVNDVRLEIVPRFDEHAMDLEYGVILSVEWKALGASGDDTAWITKHTAPAQWGNTFYVADSNLKGYGLVGMATRFLREIKECIDEKK